jgi:hypothetical protein
VTEERVAGNGSALEEASKLLRLRTISGLALSVLFLAIATFAVAEEGPVPSGKIAIQTKSLAFGIGVSWGEGTLSFAGREFRFSVNGLTMLDFGIATASAVGDVYNMTEVGLFEGTYFAGEAGFALGGGMGGTVLRNQNGVIIHLRSITQGVRFQLGGGGLTIKLEK